MELHGPRPTWLADKENKEPALKETPSSGSMVNRPLGEWGRQAMNASKRVWKQDFLAHHGQKPQKLRKPMLAMY